MAIGTVLYLVFPLAFLNEDLDLQGILLLWLLASIIAGLSLFLNNFQSALEVIFQKILFFWEKIHIKRIMLKNTLIHASANKKTALVYSVSLAILNFVYISYYLELSSLSRKSFYEKGGEIVLNNPSVFQFQKYLSFSDLEPHLDYSWIMEPIKGADHTSYEVQLPGYQSEEIPAYSMQNIIFSLTDLSKQNIHKVDISLASPNLISNLESSSEYHPFMSFKDPVDKLTSNLYMKHNFRSIIISRTLYYSFNGGLWTDKKPVYLYLQIMNPQKNKSFYKVRVAGVVDYLPGVEFSVLPYSHKKEILVSPDIFFEISSVTQKGLEDLEMKKIILKPRKEPLLTTDHFLVNSTGDMLSKTTTKSKKTDSKEKEKSEVDYEAIQQDLIKNGSFYDNQIFKLSDHVEEFKNTEKMLNLIFNGTTNLVLIICFFNLTAAMSSKITASRNQLAILRCLGLSKIRTSLIFLYDSFLVVLSASFIGLLGGSILAWMLIMQRTLFMDVPMQVHFNWTNLISIVIASFVSAFFSAFIPMILFLRRPLSQISK